MSYIIVDGISKTFKVAKRNSGLKSALKSFFKREYVTVEAVKNISFSIEKGEIVGYIGPNGAGKSTTIKMLCGILLPTAGNIRVNGMDPFTDRRKYVSNIGVVFGQRSQLAWDIPAEDTFDLLKDIYGLSDSEYQKNKKELITLLEIEDVIKKPVRSLSLGQRMRCEIVASLLHNPKILFLDEPTIGLDAKSKKVVRDFILKINKEKKVTIMLTTHDMTDIDKLAKRIILIGKGQILYDGSLNTLKSKYGSYKSITVITSELIKEIKLKGVISKKKIDGGYNFIIDSNLITVSKFINYLSNRYSIIDLDIDNENIEEVILKLYQDYEIWEPI